MRKRPDEQEPKTAMPDDIPDDIAKTAVTILNVPEADATTAQGFAGLSTADPNAVLEIVRKRDTLLKELLRLICAKTNENHWDDFGGTPRLNSKGAQIVAQRLAITVTNREWTKSVSEDKDGRYYIYTVFGDFHLPGGFHSYHAVGSCSSRDKFFAEAHGEHKTGWSVSEPNILKKAWTNCFTNGVIGVVALKGTTWDELRQAGLKQSKAASTISYDGKDKKRTETKREDAATEQRRDELINVWGHLCEYLAAENDKTVDVMSDELCKQYLPFKKPNKDGKTYADMEMVLRFKKAPALKWLEQAIDQIKEGDNFDADAFEQFCSIAELPEDDEQ